MSCNGISIDKWGYKREKLSRSRPYITMPSVSIFDSDGHLPLNLQRRDVIDGYSSFEDELLKSIAEDLIAYALVAGPERISSRHDLRWIIGSYRGINSSYWGPKTYGVYPLWNVGSSGFTLNHDAICAQVKTKSILAAFVDYRPNPLIDSEVISSLEADQLLTSVGSFPDRLNETKACLRKILSQKELTPFHDPNIDALGHRAVIQRSAIERVLTASVLGKELKKIIETATIEKQTKHWTMYRVRDCPPMSKSSCLHRINKLELANAPMAFVEAYVDSQSSKIKSNPIVDRWLEILGDPIVPWSRKERKEKFSHVYEQLRPYIAHHERALKDEQKGRKKDLEEPEE